MPNGNYDLTCNGWKGGYIQIHGTKYCDSIESGDEKIETIQVVTGRNRIR